MKKTQPQDQELTRKSILNSSSSLGKSTERPSHDCGISDSGYDQSSPFFQAVSVTLKPTNKPRQHSLGRETSLKSSVYAATSLDVSIIQKNSDFSTNLSTSQDL